MLNINFNLRDLKSPAITPVNVVIRWAGQRMVYPSQERIEPKFWSSRAQRAKEVRSFPEFSEFNHRLNSIESRIRDSYRRFVDTHDERMPSASEFKATLDEAFNRMTGKQPITLFAFIDDFISSAPDRINPLNGRRLQPTTLKKYVSTRNHLRQFASAKSLLIDFDTIDQKIYEQFVSYLTTEVGLALNSVGKYVQTLKTFLRQATEQGIEVNPTYRTKRFRTPTELTDKVYLNKEELEEISRLDLTDIPRLDRARDLFLVGAWTGLRFSDFTSIRPENIDDKRIRLRTTKTNTPVVIPLHPAVRHIVGKYADVTPNSLPPAISNQKLNEYIKEFAAEVECLSRKVSVGSTVAGSRRYVTKEKWELVTTHTCRRSFATNMYLAGVPSRSIMAITGHTTEREFLRYIRLDAEEHATLIEEKFLEVKRAS